MAAPAPPAPRPAILERKIAAASAKPKPKKTSSKPLFKAPSKRDSEEADAYLTFPPSPDKKTTAAPSPRTAPARQVAAASPKAKKSPSKPFFRAPSKRTTEESDAYLAFPPRT